MRIWQIALVMALLTAGCDDSSTAPADGDTTASFDFGGVLSPQASAFDLVSVTKAGKISVKLVSLTAGTTFSTAAAPVGTTIGLGIGVPNSDQTACTVTTSVNVGVGLTTQLEADAAEGTSCVQIFDPGNLATTVFYVVRIVHT